MKSQNKTTKRVKEVQIIDCECNGDLCCGGRGIAVFQVERKGKKMLVCTRCDLSSDKNKKILKYVTELPAQKLIAFDPLGAICLANYISDKKYPLISLPINLSKKWV